MSSPDASLTFRHEHEENRERGSMTTSVDSATGVIRGAGVGFWSVKLVNDHMRQLSAIVGDLHRAGLAVSVVVDMREAAPQTQDVSDALRRAVNALYRPADRVALVVPSSLVKMQMRRLLDAKHHEFFVSMNAAETWAFAARVVVGSAA